MLFSEVRPVPPSVTSTLSCAVCQAQGVAAGPVVLAKAYKVFRLDVICTLLGYHTRNGAVAVRVPAVTDTETVPPSDALAGRVTLQPVVTVKMFGFEALQVNEVTCASKVVRRGVAYV